MKKQMLLFISICFLAVQELHAQIPLEKSEVPSKIEEVFTNQFKDATEIQWFQANGFMVDFKNHKGNKCKAWFSMDNQLLGSSEKLSSKEIPSYISKKLINAISPIKEVNLITSNGKDKKNYEIILENDEVLFFE